MIPVRYRLPAWILVIVAIVVPWRSFQAHPHWDVVQWIPLVSPPVRTRDIVGNFALYIPFGLFYVQRARGTLLKCSAWACAISVSTEASQLYSHGRFPSVQDVVLNVAGAAFGAAVYISAGRRSSR